MKRLIRRKTRPRGKSAAQREEPGKKRTRLYKVFLALAAVVVFSTTYALILPAITMEKETFCGYEEEHTDACYEEKACLTCGLEEGEGHTHSDACYTVERVLTCGKGVHHHTAQCFSNPEADVEDAAVWSRLAEEVERTGALSADAAAVAESQLGCRESEANYLVAEDDSRKGYTRYGAWYGDPYGDWNAMFCAFCLNYADPGGGLFPHATDCAAWLETLSASGAYHPAAGYAPAVGDLIFLSLSEGEGTAPTRMGIVSEIITDESGQPAELRVIEGDCPDGSYPDCVACRSYAADDSRIVGYAGLTAPVYTQGTLQSAPAPDGAVAVVSGCLPEGAQVTVTPVTLSPAELSGYLGQERAAAVTAAAAYDIKITVNGVEWEPDETVSVSLQQPALGVEPEAGFAVAHVDDRSGETELLDARQSETGEVSFETDGFSLYVLYHFTVDFHYNELTYRLGGMDTVLLSEVLRSLSVDLPLSEVAAVAFSDESLLTVEPTGDGDWRLSSLQAFSSAETLSLTLTDGRTLLLSVTDDVTEMTTLTVTKSWTDGAASHDPVTVSLVNKNDSTDIQSVELSDDNSWSHSFSIPVPATGALPAYTVTEEASEDYISEIGEMKKTLGTTEQHYWQPVSENAFEDGGQYAIYSESYIIVKSGSSAKGQPVETGEINGVSSAIAGDKVPSTGVWTATASSSSGYFSLENGEYDLSSVGGSSSLRMNGGKIQFSSGGKYLIVGSSLSTHSNSGKGTAVILYEEVNIPATPDTYQVTITNQTIQTPDTPDPSDPSAPSAPTGPELHKQIDYLGDSGTNPDTSAAGSDLYRLYLDITCKSKPVDLLLVVDASSSMDETDMPYNGTDCSREFVLDEIVNGIKQSPVPEYNRTGTYGIRDRSAAVRASAGGMVYQFLKANPQNKVAVTSYGGGRDITVTTLDTPLLSYQENKDLYNPIQQSWATLADMPNGGATPEDCYVYVGPTGPSGTNYMSGLVRAEEMLTDPAIADDGNEKIMVFLTDGVPNVFLEPLATSDPSDPFSAADWGIRDPKVLNAQFLSSYPSPYSYTNPRTAALYGTLCEDFPDMKKYIVGISKDATEEAAEAIEMMVEADTNTTNKTVYSPANDADTLMEALMSTIAQETVLPFTITDSLSDYVDFAGKPDLLVTMCDETGANCVTLWEGNGATSANLVDGVPILQSVTLDGKTARAEFNPNMPALDSKVFTMSYNVALTDKAGVEVLANGYSGVTGDGGTDYVGNKTSAGKPGLRSNDAASAVYRLSGGYYRSAYPHPVVQVSVEEKKTLRLKKVDAYDGEKVLSGAVFELYRTCAETDAGAVLIPGGDGSYGIVQNSAPLTVSADSPLEVSDLLPGSYVLVETQAPPGYSQLTQPVSFTLTTTGLTTDSEAAAVDGTDSFLLLVKNKSGYELPHSGGPGTALFTAGGIVLMAAALCLFRQRREGGAS